MIFILTGPVHSGKTTFLNKVIYALKNQGVKIDGFLSKSVGKREETHGYDLFDLKEEKSIPYIRREGEKGWQKIGSFLFIPQGLAEAEKIILRGKDSGILIVDEIGPLELEGKGVWPALKNVIFQPLTHYLFVVRTNILEDFLRVLGKSEVKVFNIKDRDAYRSLIKELKEAIK